jgi:hypothetical protein
MRGRSGGLQVVDLWPCNFRTPYWYKRSEPSGRQADELATGLVAVPEADDHLDHHGIKKTHPSLSARASFFIFVLNQ